MASNCKCSHFKMVTKKPPNFPSDLDLYEDNEMSLYAGEKVLPRQIGDWKKEWRIILQIGQTNQNILRYFTACSCNPKNTIIISELCDEDLETYIKNTAERAPMDLLQGIAQGVQHLHCNGIIHCNIKPSSIFLSKNSKNQIKAKLGRFVYSKKIDKNGIQISPSIKTDMNNGIYVAPECCKDEFWSKSSDVFALGILMYYALTRGMYPEFVQTNGRRKTVNSLQNEKAEPKFAHLRRLQKRCTGFKQEKWITVIDLIKRMIKFNHRQRLRIEEVLFHPAFYCSQKKLDFLLKVFESVKYYKGKNCQEKIGKKINNALWKYDAELMNDDKSGNVRNVRNVKYGMYGMYGM